MKFKTTLDAQTFLTEIGDIERAMTSDSTYTPTNEEVKTFIKKRANVIKKLKNYSKSRDGKLLWRRNRHKMLKAVRGFHKSVAGKRFHKKLGRFLATRITRNEDSDLKNKHEALIGLNSLKQHLMVELDYFHQSIEQAELENLVFENAIPMLQNIENKLIVGEAVDDDELCFLFDMISENEITKGVAIILQMEHNIITELFSSTKKEVENMIVEKKADTFYSVFIDVLQSNTNKLQGR